MRMGSNHIKQRIPTSQRDIHHQVRLKTQNGKSNQSDIGVVQAWNEAMPKLCALHEYRLLPSEHWFTPVTGLLACFM